MNAWIQRIATLVGLAAALAVAVGVWQRSPVLAVLAFVALAQIHALFLAIEFMAARLWHGNDPAPLATWRELLQACGGELLVCTRTFMWWQPFRADAWPDHSLAEPAPQTQPRRGVVFIHGFFCNRGFWTPWMQQLTAEHRVFVALTLEPAFGSIDRYADTVEAAVERVTKATGLPPVLVCHSMGGLAARAWLRTAPGNGARVHRIVTIGTPHHGTALAQFSHVVNGRQMRVQSRWLTQLNNDLSPQDAARLTCWYSNCDNIVFPVSTATLAGADNRLVRARGHVDLAYDQQVLQDTWQWLN